MGCESCFTGKERDAESGNDYFGARYYASSMGRFMSPDWSAKEDPVPYAKLDDPQSLNLYSYVQNNPLKDVDADGHQHLGCSTSECAAVMNKAYSQAASNPYVQGGALLGAAALAGPEVLVAAGEATTVTQGLGVGVAALGVTGTAVNGTTTIIGAATNTNVDAGTNMVTNVTNPVAATVGLATGSAEKGAQAADLATVVKAGIGAAQGKGVSNPAEVVTSLAGARSAAADIVNKVTSAISGAMAPTPTPPPTPAPPGPPSCSVAGACGK
jgi:RHS repeat-associated protein